MCLHTCQQQCRHALQLTHTSTECNTLSAHMQVTAASDMQATTHAVADAAAASAEALRAEAAAAGHSAAAAEAASARQDADALRQEACELRIEADALRQESRAAAARLQDAQAHAAEAAAAAAGSRQRALHLQTALSALQAWRLPLSEESGTLEAQCLSCNLLLKCIELQPYSCMHACWQLQADLVALKLQLIEHAYGSKLIPLSCIGSCLYANAHESWETLQPQSGLLRSVCSAYTHRLNTSANATTHSRQEVADKQRAELAAAAERAQGPPQSLPAPVLAMLEGAEQALRAAQVPLACHMLTVIFKCTKLCFWYVLACSPRVQPRARAPWVHASFALFQVLNRAACDNNNFQSRVNCTCQALGSRPSMGSCALRWPRCASR